MRIESPVALASRRYLLESVCFPTSQLLLKANSAENGLGASRQERNSRLLPALAALDGCHPSIGAIELYGFASLAQLGIVLEPVLMEEFLFGSRKNKI